MSAEISIVMVNYNYGRFIKTAIESVVSQACFDRCELIVVDGGSTDESVDIIQSYSQKIRWWCSERDRGQSDAFNKGFSHATGRLGCWLNADDIMLPGTIEAVLGCLSNNPGTDWITGGTLFFNDDLEIWRARLGTGITKGMHRWVNPTVIGGPSSFFSLKHLRDAGGFNVNLRYTMDGDLWNRLFAAGLIIKHINKYFWGFRMHDQSKTAHSLVGARNASFRAEDAEVFSRYRSSALLMIVHRFELILWKLINGSMLKSFYDTMRLKGCCILEFK